MKQSTIFFCVFGSIYMKIGIASKLAGVRHMKHSIYLRTTLSIYTKETADREELKKEREIESTFMFDHNIYTYEHTNE